MSIFSRKEKVNLEDFCRDIYDNQFLNPKISEKEVSDVFPEFFKGEIVKVLPEFENISLQQIKEEIIFLRFELFALAWIHSFGIQLSVEQSIFTKNYLHEKGRDDIWNGMGHYNKAISHSVTSELSKLDQASIIKMRVDLFDKFAEKNGLPSTDIGLGLAINRISSEKVWGKRITHYFLMLKLCHKFGLGFGKDYYGPNEEAQFQFAVFIKGFYDGAQQSWDKVKIISDLEKNILVFKKAIKNTQNRGSAYYNLGCAYWKHNRYSEAIEAFKQVIRIDPKLDIVYEFLGRIYVKLNLYKEAIEAFKQAIRINPNDATYHYHLSHAYLLIGDKSLALNEYKILKELDSKNKSLNPLDIKEANKLLDLINQ
jgi:tetratricopeptide (TPR) repeat protein